MLVELRLKGETSIRAEQLNFIAGKGTMDIVVATRKLMYWGFKNKESHKGRIWLTEFRVHVGLR